MSEAHFYKVNTEVLALSHPGKKETFDFHKT